MVGFIYDPIFLAHDTGPYHPETAERLRAILRHIEPLKKQLLRLTPIAASEALLQSVHTAEHIERVAEASRSGTPLDPDTPTSQDSFEAALRAAGAGALSSRHLNKRPMLSSIPSSVSQ